MFHDVGPNSSKTHFANGLHDFRLKKYLCLVKKKHNYSGFRPYVDIGETGARILFSQTTYP